MKKLFSIYLILLIAIFSSCSDDDAADPLPENPADMPYDVDIDPDNFISSGFTGNDFFSLVPGKIMIYEGEEDDGLTLRVEVENTNQTKVIMGVTCVVVRDKAFVNDELVEDTYDWYAQDVAGNVWYFGEATEEIENGVAVNTDGSWEAGVDGALPGVIMLANPLVGLWYRQEYFKGEAEDVAQVLNLSATVTVPFGGPYNNCVQIAEWNLLEPGVIEHKFYAPGVGLVKIVTTKGGAEFEQLVDIN